MSFRLTYLTTSVILRSPDWDNIVSIDTNDIKRWTRGGDYLTYYDPYWAKIVIHKYQFSCITKDIKDDFFDFITTFAGLQIQILDHLNTTRTGFISTPINEIIAVRPDCSFSLNFEFMVQPL